jgi:hypothetical protein
MPFDQRDGLIYDVAVHRNHVGAYSALFNNFIIKSFASYAALLARFDAGEVQQSDLDTQVAQTGLAVRALEWTVRELMVDTLARSVPGMPTIAISNQDGRALINDVGGYGTAADSINAVAPTLTYANVMTYINGGNNAVGNAVVLSEFGRFYGILAGGGQPDIPQLDFSLACWTRQARQLFHRKMTVAT